MLECWTSRLSLQFFSVHAHVCTQTFVSDAGGVALRVGKLLVNIYLSTRVFPAVTLLSCTSGRETFLRQCLSLIVGHWCTEIPSTSTSDARAAPKQPLCLPTSRPTRSFNLQTRPQAPVDRSTRGTHALPPLTCASLISRVLRPRPAACALCARCSVVTALSGAAQRSAATCSCRARCSELLRIPITQRALRPRCSPSPSLLLYFPSPCDLPRRPPRPLTRIVLYSVH